MLAKLQKFNKSFMRVTWMILIIDSVDHFSCEFEITKFACEKLPHEVAQYNLKLLWAMVAIVCLGEIAVWVLKKKGSNSENQA